MKNPIAYRVKGRIRSFVLLLLGIGPLFFATTQASNIDELTGFDQLTDETRTSDAPTILTATGLPQSRQNAPGTIYTLDQKFIKKLQPASLVELLRYIPGVAVDYRSGSTPQLAFRNINFNASRHEDILIDGQSFVWSGYTAVSWQFLPIALSEVERIEVVTNPSSSRYSDNAFAGVINIITKHPEDTLGTSIEVKRGSNSAFQYGLIHGARLGEHATIRLRVESKGDDGFKSFSAREYGKPYTSSFPEYIELVNSAFYISESNKNDYSHKRLDLKLSHSRGDFDNMIKLGFLEGNYHSYETRETEVENLHLNIQSTWRQSQNHSLKTKLTALSMEESSEGGQCIPRWLLFEELADLYKVDPALAHSTVWLGPSPMGSDFWDVQRAFIDRVKRESLINSFLFICGTFALDNKDDKLDLSIESSYAINENLKTIAGIGFKTRRNDSRALFGDDEVAVNNSRLYFNVEYIPNARFTYNLGMMAEEGVYDNIEVSPKVGVNYHLNSQQTLRAVISKGIRKPDSYETHRDSTLYFTPDKSGGAEGLLDHIYSRVLSGNEKVDSEEIISRELGFQWLGRRGLELDLRYFHESLEDIRSSSLDPLSQDASLNFDTRRQGGELVLSHHLSNRLSYNASLSYVDSESKQLFAEFHRKQGAAFVSYAFDFLTATLAHFSNSAVFGKSYDKTELILTKDMLFRNNRALECALKLSRLKRFQQYIVNEGTAALTLHQNEQHSGHQFDLSLAYHF